MKQTKYRRWLGAIQVQIANSAFYDSFVSMAMLGTTLWYTAGYEITRTYAPWFTLPMFFGLGIIYKIVVMILDYKYMYQSRIGFQSEQVYRPHNPTVADIQQIKSDMVKIKEKLGIDD